MDPQYTGEVVGPSSLKRPDDRLAEQPALPAALVRERGPEPIVRFEEVSKWYGNVIGINKLTLNILPGVTGLLGPNGAGKSTLLQLATGQLRPTQGTVRVLGHPVWNNPGLNRHIGVCPEQDAFYEWMTGWDFVLTCGRLSGLRGSKATERAAHALEVVGMTPNKDRAIRGYSK